MRGQRHEWMAYAGHHDERGRGIRHRLRGSIANNPHHPPQWFVRSEEFACAQPRTVLQRGTRSSPVVRPSLFRYAVGIADATAGRPRRRRASREQRCAYPASRRCRRGDEVMTGQTTFPGGTSVTLLDVYDDAGPDGLRGGSTAHASGIHGVLRGDRWTRCAAHARPSTARARPNWSPETVVWFTPGTIHRAINDGGSEGACADGQLRIARSGRRGHDVPSRMSSRTRNGTTRRRRFRGGRARRSGRRMPGGDATLQSMAMRFSALRSWAVTMAH